MSEPTPPTPGRTRRRASRRAGPVDVHDQVGGTTGESAAVTVERADAGTAGTAGAGVEQPAKLEISAQLDSIAKDTSQAASSSTDVSAAAKPDSAKSDDRKAKDAGPVDAEPVDTGAESSKTTLFSRLRPLEWAAVVVAAISLFALIVTAGFNIHHSNSLDALSSQRAQYVQTAKQAILNLTNIKDDTAQQDIDRVLSVASGDLKAEYSQQKDAYAQVVQQAKVKASGEVIEAGIESQGDDTATVLVAAKQTLTNAGDTQPQDRYYRFRVTVNRAADGTVTASKVEFVA